MWVDLSHGLHEGEQHLGLDVVAIRRRPSSEPAGGPAQSGDDQPHSDQLPWRLTLTGFPSLRQADQLSPDCLAKGFVCRAVEDRLPGLSQAQNLRTHVLTRLDV
ncbi:hypothetical protein UK12_29845 [Saccharothrix sp. ST-888]|nr:hypothetical protein UK12_29845 [Saccharothrix sp. ST-888]